MKLLSPLLQLSAVATVSSLSVRHKLQVRPAAARYLSTSTGCSASALPLSDEETLSAIAPQVPTVFPAREPLPSFISNHDECFSLLSWNILLPNSQDNWWCHKQFSSNVDMEKRQWPHRHKLIKERILQSAADIVCIQEADGDTFEADFAFMKDAGYDHVLHKKFRFRCATFFKQDKLALENDSHKDRALITALRRTTPGEEQLDNILHIVNCHLSGGAAPERRLRQVHGGLDQIRKWGNAVERTLQSQQKGNRPSPKLIAKAQKAHDEYQKAGIVVCGDFNSDGNTAVRKLLVEGSVEPDWYEPQYPSLQLTSKQKTHPFGSFADTAELAWNSNVCDGGYSEVNSVSPGTRPATYVVPNLASLLLLPLNEEEEAPLRTEFGLQVAQGVATTLGLENFCEMELEQAFEKVDHDGNGSIDRDEVLALLESSYVATYGQNIEQEMTNFFRGFGTKNQGSDGLTKDEFIARLKSLQNDAEGERKAFGLARGFNLLKLTEDEMEQAFMKIDLDGNGLLDENEYSKLLESVYVSIYGEEIDKQRSDFFTCFKQMDTWDGTEELTKEQFTDRLLALHQELDGARTGTQLTEVRTEADAEKMIERFTPLLQHALDTVFDKFSSNGDTLTQAEVNEYLIKTNGMLGRGGMFRHTTAILEKKKELLTEPAELSRRDWFKCFARELAEGKWWQVVFDLEVCDYSVRPLHSKDDGVHQLYQGWLDYIYFHSETLCCTGVQDVLTEDERAWIYEHGDALPNSWHPSDHLPIASTFSWK